jgi:hypothetical protein
MRHFELDPQGNPVTSYARPQPGRDTTFLEEPSIPIEYARWNGSAWEPRLGARKLEAAKILSGFATQILALSDIIIHAFEEQGGASGYSQAEYDAEVAKRVNLRNGLSTRFGQIRDATTIEELEGLEADFATLYENQLQSYAEGFLPE